MAAESEFDKQKALLEQKVEFLERQLSESQLKEKELSSEVKNQKRDHFNSVKDLQAKLEQQIKDLNKKVEEQSEAIFEWETKHQDLETKYEQESAKWDDTEAQKGKDFAKLKETLAETQRNYETIKKKYTDDVENLKVSQEEEQVSRSERIRDLELQARSAEEALDLARQRWEKDQAIAR